MVPHRRRVYVNSGGRESGEGNGSGLSTERETAIVDKVKKLVEKKEKILKRLVELRESLYEDLQQYKQMLHKRKELGEDKGKQLLETQLLDKSDELECEHRKVMDEWEVLDLKYKKLVNMI